MCRPAFTEEQFTFALKQGELGVSVTECCGKMGISDQAFDRLKGKVGGLGVAEVRRLKMLEEESRKLEQLVADSRLDKVMLQDALQRRH